MLLTGISLLGWLHSLACVIAIFAGATVLYTRKGTARHRLWGRWYAGAMVVLNISIMGVYRFDVLPGRPPEVGPDIFGIFHWMAVVTLALVALAVFAARRQKRVLWAHVHVQAMLLSYYLLIGGLINEMFVRFLPLRNFAQSLSPDAGNPVNTMLAQQAHAASILTWLALAFWFARKVRRDRRLRAEAGRYADTPRLPA